ncbi:hypothetical protein Patl1_25081 [Pistacia atlantica]|uniref:Uncharacterized protein n=1 Tax=Pistacia atlantica TaxID=434234 RepID=A0ACC1B294_9ROSI|nr:hypothetical protein Patl1_25081 [Pistacia atlantica]
MNESQMFGSAKKFLGKLGSLPYAEVCSGFGVKTGLEKMLEETLSTIKSVLLDAEEQRMTYWMSSRLKLYERKFPYHQSVGKKVWKFFISCSNPVVFRFGMGHRMKKIRGRFNEIAEIKGKFNLKGRINNSGMLLREREMAHFYVLASDVIGRDEDTENIIKLLIESSDNGTVSVIPIVGIGGPGKTAFTKLQIERCKHGIGEDWPKIAHVLEIWLDGKMIVSNDY